MTNFSEKRQRRIRHIYALLFSNNCCYIGQSVNLNRRLAQHKHRNGKWGRQKFYMVRLDKIKGTYADGEDLECAWRCCAQRQGWTIYGLPPNIVVDPLRKLNSKRSKLMRACVWPRKHRAVGWGGEGLLKIFVAVAVFLGLCVYLGWFPHVMRQIENFL